MLGLPPTTEVKRPLPKAQFFKRFDWTPSQRQRFDGEVSRLDFVNWISPRTVPAVAVGNEVKEIFVVEEPKKHGEVCEDFHHNSRLASIIGAFKAGVTRATRTRRIASLPVWQSRYHEHVIKNQSTFERIMNYIDSNVENWHIDRFAK